jgi:hypothetical protein
MNKINMATQYLRERSPVKVCTAHVEVFPVHDPQLRVQNAAAHERAKIEALDLDAGQLGQLLSVPVGEAWGRKVLSYFDADSSGAC